MTVSLGAISLRSNLLLNGLDADVVAADTQRTDDGFLTILLSSVSGGRELSLEGWFTRAQETAISALSSGKIPVALSHPKFSGNVFIVGMALTDLFDFVEAETTDIRVGIINLIEA